MPIEIVRTIASLRQHVAAWRAEGGILGMVPTMGALHDGHLALARAAATETDRVVATLFVNPAQFAPNEDLNAYPRDEGADRLKLSEVGADLLFAPSVAEMYLAGFDTKIVVGGPSADLETAFRPQHFTGVATIVAKLLLAGLPDRAYFGEKDYQQLLVVKQLVRDLGIPTEIVGCPTVREPDGLALSSRNAYLSVEERQRAPKLHAVMREVATHLRNSDAAESALAEGRKVLAESGCTVDYLEARNADTLARVTDWRSEPLRLLVAARLGRTRLIDNIAV